MLYEHQQHFLDKNPDRALLVWSVGLGKGYAGALWLRDRDTDALIICPKRVVKKWQKEIRDAGTKATVLSKEQFKKTDLKKYSAIIIDEVHNHSAPCFVAKQRSQLAEHTYNLIQHNEDTPLLLLSATPVSSAPHNLHTILTYMQLAPTWKEWRKRFYNLESRPYLAGKAWMPKPDWRKEIRKELEKHADIVTLKDVVTETPEETEDIVYTTAPACELEEWEPAARFHEERRNEQIPKPKKILEIAEGYQKVAVSAHYVEQCEHLAEELGKYRETFLITGKEKNQEEVIKNANEAGECFLVFQGSLGEGWEFPKGECLIFASMPFGVKAMVQAKGRIQRINDLHPVNYFHIIGGRCDQAVYDSVMAGKEFIPSQWKL